MNDPRPAVVQTSRRPKRLMLLIFLICLLPWAAAYLLYQVGPERLFPGRVNYGTLIQPTRPLPSLDLRAADGSQLPASAFEGHWSVIVVGGKHCNARCITYTREIGNIRPLLRDQMQRLEVFYLAPDLQALRLMRREMAPVASEIHLIRWGIHHASVPDYLNAGAGSVITIDPMRNGVLSYGPWTSPKNIYLDLRLLLRYSHIG